MTTATEILAQLEPFRQSLPRVCACTDQLGVTLYRTRTVAQLMRYIGPNHPNSVNHLVFDLDRPLAVLDWEDANAPPPTWVAINPGNGHAHYGYSLASPIHFNPDSSRKAQRYGAAIEDALGAKLRADRSYAGNLTKNPLNPFWTTVCFSDLAYELDRLGSHLDLEGRFLDLRRKLPAVGLGRNCSLFDGLRHIAYRERRNPQGWFEYSFFEAYLDRIAQGMNHEFLIPLGDREVHGIAKSVARWTWENLSPEGFRMWGDARRAKSIRVRGARSAERAQRIRELAGMFPDLTQRELARIAKVSVWTVNTALARP